jgi:hypothetical protein
MFNFPISNVQFSPFMVKQKPSAPVPLSGIPSKVRESE